VTSKLAIEPEASLPMPRGLSTEIPFYASDSYDRDCSLYIVDGRIVDQVTIIFREFLTTLTGRSAIPL